MSVWQRLRWGLCGIGFALPLLWFGATIRLYAWLPEYRSPAHSLAVVVTLSFISTAAVILFAPISLLQRIAAIATIWILIVIQVGGLLSWVYFSMSIGTEQRPVEPTAAWMQPIVSDWCLQSPGRPHSVQSVSGVIKADDAALRFELRQGECYADLFGKTSFRAEVNTRGFPPLGSTNRYAFSLLLPHDFPVEENRLVLVQWHGADKKYLGEPSRSPALAFRYSRGKFSITSRHSTDRIVRDPGAVPSRVLFETDQFALGTWHDFIVQAKWSCQHDGRVDVWWNGHQVVQYSGPVGYNDDFGPYFKFGLYRDDSAMTYVAYFSQVKMEQP